MTRAHLPPTLIVVLALTASVVGTGGSALAQDLPPGGTFVDDDGSVYEPPIEAIAAAGITKGCNPPVNDRFCPGKPVLRAEMAAFISRALRLPAPPPGNRFVDDDGSIFENDIERLAAAGITKGCNPPANTRFCPGDSISRGEMAAMLVRAYRYPADPPGDRFVDDDGSIFEKDIERLAAAGITKGCNPPANTRFCPGDDVSRGQMAAFLMRAEGLTPIVPPPVGTPRLVPVAEGLSAPVHVAAPEGDGRVFIVEKGGRIRILTADGNLRSRPFLDISGAVSSSGERGLLGLAFHPDYADNGRFFVYYSRTGCPSGDQCNHTSVVAEYEVSSGDRNVADPSGSTVLQVAQPFSNHNAGHLEFGPDGRLYIALGDGGSGNDPGNNGQDTGTLLGSILRIDIDGPGAYTNPSDNPFVGRAGRDEIWVYGLRNPWRFAFDGGRLFIGDVGQGEQEEIDAVAVDGAAGRNFGWRRFEGTRCTGLGSCSTAGLTFPVLTYSHSQGCSVTGGRVYRGEDITRMVGHYLYGDLCEGRIRSFRLVGGKATDRTDWTSALGTTVESIVSFGEDGDGDLYVVSLTGTVYRLEAR